MGVSPCPDDRLLRRLSRSRVRFEDCHILHPDAPIGHRLKPIVPFIVKVLGQIFGGRINHGEGLMSLIIW